MSNNPFSLDIMTAPLSPIYQGCDNYDYSGTHMGERKVVVTFQSATAIDFMVGDYITFNGEKFTLQTAPITSRIFSSHMIQYILTFWWQGYELQLANFLDVLPSGDDSSVYFNKTSEVIINDTLLRVCGRIIANLDRSGYIGWTFDIHGSVDVVTPKDIEAINVQCYDVLQNMSTVFGVEYRFDNATKTIFIGYPPEETALFEYGKDKGICEINRVQNDQKVITRVRGFGSTRNITPNYRHVEATLEYHTRLILPEDQSPLPIPNERYSIIGGYLVDTIQEAAYGIREGVPYINEDIYPTIEGLNNTVFAVGGVTDRPTESTPQYNTVVVTPEWTEWRLKYAYQGEIWQEAHPDYVPEYVSVIHPAVIKEELVETVPQGTYDTATFFVPDLGFDLNDESIKTGEPAKICFTTGNLVDAGELVIASFTKYMTLVAGVPTWDDGLGNQLWKITVVRNSDDPNHIKPSEAVPIQVGDKFVYLNIFLPATYEDAAEARLLAATIEYLKANTKSPEGYAIRLSEEYFTKYPLTLGKFKEGNAVTIRDTVLGLTQRAVLIQAMSVSYKDNALLPVYNLTISDVPIKGSLDAIRAGIKQSNQTITSRIITAENNTNSALKSAYILTSRILDNNLDIRGDIIAAQSITPISQSVELKSAHYMLQAMVTVNYEGEVNAANGSAGVLIHKEEDVVWADTYDLTHQTWTIAAPQTFSLLDGVRYFVYIKGSLVDGTAVWVVSQTKILATQDQGFYYFEWGSILAPIEGSRYTQTFTGLSHNPVSVNPASAAMASIDPVTQVLTIAGGGGGSAPATIDSTTTNEDNGTTHTHELGNIAIDNIVSGSPVEYGALYNWRAATNSKNISNIGWSVITTDQWDSLISFIGGYTSGGKLKETGLAHWLTPNSSATNDFGFNAVGGGYRDAQSGVFAHIKDVGYNWLLKGTAFYTYDWGTLYSYDTSTGWSWSNDNTMGASIRLAKDSTTLTHGQIGTYIGNDGKKYPTICINGIEYLSCNLNETKYRDGSWISGFDNGVYTTISNANWVSRGNAGESLMCYYSDNEAYGGGQTPLSTQHNSLAGLNTGDYQHLTAAELAKVHNPVTIATESANIASIDENQVLTVESQVSDEAYSTAWDGVLNTAPSKNAVYDKISSMEPINYAPTSLTVNFGTLNQGTFTNLAAVGGTDVIVQERVANPPFEIVIGFTGVQRLSGFKFYGEYAGSPSHVVHVEGYNYNTSTWDFLGEISSNGGKHWYAFNFNLANNYLSAGTVQVRLQHQGSGNITHQMIIDYANVNYGGGGGANFIGAGAVAFTSDGNISATNVQAAIEELDDEKVEEAPIDGINYARKDGGWAELGTISTKDYWSGTLAAYTAISTKDANTIYFVEE